MQREHILLAEITHDGQVLEVCAHGWLLTIVRHHLWHRHARWSGHGSTRGAGVPQLVNDRLQRLKPFGPRLIEG
eukprot:6120681-Alexandrium_andersonii.AAC.1